MVNDIKEIAKKRMDGVIDQLNTNLSSVRTGRANAMILDRVKAEYYGTLTPVNQMAAIKTPDAHTLVIEPWDKSSLGAIEAAIMNANLGVNPNNDGQVIRLPFPSLTEERRKELVGEGEVFYDYLRNGLAIERKGSWHLETLKASNAQKIEATDLRIALPIPQSEIDANPNIQQNPR